MKVRVKSREALLKIYKEGALGLETIMIDDYAGKVIEVKMDDLSDYKMINLPDYNWFWRKEWISKIPAFHMTEFDV